jgi:2-aminoadipate transaminase
MGDATSRIRELSKSPIRELLKLTNLPGFISFMGGYPDEDTFELDYGDIGSQIEEKQLRPTATQYGLTSGYAPLRKFIAEKLLPVWAELSPLEEQVLITPGSQSVLFNMGLLFEKNGQIAMVKPYYPGAKQAFSITERSDILFVDSDNEGMTPTSLEKILRDNSSVNFVYLNSEHSNPDARTMSLERRKDILRICREHGVYIVDDNAYRGFRFAGEPIKPITSLEQELYGEI